MARPASRNPEVGRRIRARREAAGVSINALARKAGVSSTFLRMIETDNAGTSAETRKKLALALGCAEEDFAPAGLAAPCGCGGHAKDQAERAGLSVPEAEPLLIPGGLVGFAVDVNLTVRDVRALLTAYSETCRHGGKIEGLDRAEWKGIYIAMRSMC